MKKILGNKNLFMAIFLFWYTSEIIVNMELEEIGGISINLINDITNYLTLGALVIQIGFFQKYTQKDIIKIGLLSLPILVSAALSGFLPLLSTWLFIVAAKDVDFDQLMHYILRILIVSLTVVITLFLLRIIPEYALFERRGIVRHSLGFAHPNLLGEYIFQIIVCFLYIRRRKWKLIDFVLIIPAFLFVYFVPNSQSSCACMVILFVFLMIYIVIERWNQTLLRLYRCGMVLLYGVANLGSVFLSIVGVEWSSVVRRINQLLSARFSSSHRDLEIFGISLLGQHVYISAEERELVGITEKLWLDNGYMALMIRLGVITYLLFSVLYLLVMLYNKREKHDMALIFFAVYAIYGIMENAWFLTKHNLFLLLFATYIYEKNNPEADYPILILKNWGGKLIGQFRKSD